MKLKDFKLVDSLAANLRNDDFLTLASIIDVVHSSLDSDKTLIYPNLESVDENLLDYLGQQQHIERYNKLLERSNKEELIRNSFLLHKKKGTVWSIKTALSLTLAPTDIQEWFEYGGQPYFFRPFIDFTDARVALGKEKKFELLRIINENKNVRSWLDKIDLKTEIADELKNINDFLAYNLEQNFVETFPYKSSYPLLFPFKYGDFNIDDLHLLFQLNFDDCYHHLNLYGDFHFPFEYGDFSKLPVEWFDDSLFLSFNDCATINDNLLYHFSLDFFDSYDIFDSFGHINYPFEFGSLSDNLHSSLIFYFNDFENVSDDLHLTVTKIPFYGHMTFGTKYGVDEYEV